MGIQIRKYTARRDFFARKTDFILEAKIVFGQAEKRALNNSGLRSNNILFVCDEDCDHRDGATFEISKLMQDRVQSVAFPNHVIALKYETVLNENLEVLTRLRGSRGQAGECVSIVSLG